MMLTIEADDAWWPPTFTPLGVRRTRLAWWTMLVASHRTRRWTASRVAMSMSRAGMVVLMGAGRFCQAAGSPARGEEAREQRGAFAREDPARHGGPVVQARLGEHVEHAAGGARLRVGAAEDDPRHAREDDRPRAHRARLERHVQRAVEDAPRAKRGG